MTLPDTVEARAGLTAVSRAIHKTNEGVDDLSQNGYGGGGGGGGGGGADGCFM